MRRISILVAVTVLSIVLSGCAGTSPAPRTTPDRPPSDTPVVGSTAPSSASAPSERIPLDPAVTSGKLENGVSYFIRTNHKPEKRAELRLVIDAGSVLEDEDQRGLAHFIEHMAFNGTKNFEKQELVDYLEGIGMRFGPDLNAYTSLDETVYKLRIPTDDPEIVRKAFQILEDWAHNVSFDDEEIDKERGVVIEEWRLGRGARGRIRDKQFPVTYHDSRYAERRVIGDKETLENAPYETLRRYYRDWYRPDLMAIVAVGDFDAASIEKSIRKHFNRLEMPDTPRERVEYPIPDHDETLTSIVTDPEATSINVTVGYKRPQVLTETVADLRNELIDSLYHGMMINRLQELTQKADPPFQFGFAASGGLGRTKSMYRLFARVRDGGVERGLETLLIEAKRVEEHGFTATELERSKADLLRGVEQQYEERDKVESDRFTREYVDYFLDDDPSPGIEYIRDIFEEMVPGITLEEINARADQWITEINRVILVSGPEKEEAAIPEEDAVLAVFDAARDIEVLPWVDEVRDEPLVPDPPEPGRIVEESRVEELDLTRWTLSNGVRVLLKPTDFKNDEILLRGWSPGGHSLASDEDYLSASFADSVVSQGGAGEFNRVELEKALSGIVAGASTWIGELNEGVRGSASPQDLETMFQLVYLGFTGARRDEEAFQAYQTKMRGWLENREASPGYQFGVRFSRVMAQGHDRREPLTHDRVDEIDLDRSLAFYSDRFADASDFVFTLVGNIDLESVRPLVERWLGGLPATGREETWRDVGVRAPVGVRTFDVLKGIEPKSQVRIRFHGEAEWNLENRHLISSLARAMSIRLREVMREDMGGVYGVRVSGGISRYPLQRSAISISFSCDPERAEELIAAVFKEIHNFRLRGPTEEEVSKVKEAQIRNREVSLERNAFWIGQLEFHETYDLDPLEILKYDELVEISTLESLRRAARVYLDVDQYVQGVLYPEENSTPAAEVQ